MKKPKEKQTNTHNKKVKKYCKGCLCDVTETMWCYCAESPLNEESIYTEEDLKLRDKHIQL